MIKIFCNLCQKVIDTDKYATFKARDLEFHYCEDCIEKIILDKKYTWWALSVLLSLNKRQQVERELKNEKG